MAKTTETKHIEARFFELDLTEEEREQRRVLSTEQIGQLEMARLDEKNLAKDKKAQVEELEITKIHRDAKQRADELEIRARRNAKAAREGRESRLMDCEWSFREDDQTMILTRLDDGKEVDRRKATKKEIDLHLQGQLFGGDGGLVN